jgi:cell wall assembly regulator SMI1
MATMNDLWDRLKSHFEKHAPAVLGTLNPAAAESKIRAAEKRLGVSLPADLIASLKIHNGQVWNGISLVPAEHNRLHLWVATWGYLSPLEQVVRDTLSEWKGMANLSFYAEDFRYRGPVRRSGNWSWLVFVNSGSGDRLGLDLNPPRSGHVGQVLSICHDPPSLYVLAPSYREWFQTLVERYESGRYIVSRSAEDGHYHSFDRLDRDFPG